MKKARFILTALVLLAGIGGALAVKISRFTANPVQISTDFSIFKVAGNTYTAYAGLNGAPALLCSADFLAYWTAVPGITLVEFTTLPSTTSVLFTRTTSTVGGTTTLTITKTVHLCTETTGLATLNI